MVLQGRSIAVLAYPGYQELEFWYPVLRAREEQAQVYVIASAPDGVESFLGYPVRPNTTAEEVDPASVDVLLAPGVVNGTPEASDAQRELVRAVQAAGGALYATGSGADLIRDILGDDAPIAHVEPGPDELPALLTAMRA